MFSVLRDALLVTNVLVTVQIKKKKPQKLGADDSFLCALKEHPFSFLISFYSSKYVPKHHFLSIRSLEILPTLCLIGLAFSDWLI